MTEPGTSHTHKANETCKHSWSMPVSMYSAVLFLPGRCYPYKRNITEEHILDHQGWRKLHFNSTAIFWLCWDRTGAGTQRVWGKSSHCNWPNATITATWSTGKAQGSNYITNKACLKLWINQTAENKTFLSGTSDKRNENNKAGWVMKSQHTE